MSAIICNKCGTSNSGGTDKCSNCGFSFANLKMHTVGKYLGDIAPKPTIVEKVISGTSYAQPIPTIVEPVPSIDESLEANNSDFTLKGDLEQSKYENNVSNVMEDVLTEVTSEKPHLSLSKEFSQNIENSIHEDSTKEIDKDDKPIVDHQNFETERISSETVSNNVQPDEELDNNCNKCGYILSSFSTICPNCGHENSKAKMTMRMPDPSTESTSVDKKHQTSKDTNSIHETGAYPLITKNNDSSKTISEQTFATSQDRDSVLNPNATQRHELSQSNNKTIREGYNHLEEENEEEDRYILAKNQFETITKSPIRLEAIYLGQDSDQKMIINMPPYANLLNITRSLVDEGDSTISSGIHATIYKEGNEWKIENKASNKAVFVQVNDTSNIKDGDIIMMGGDKFYVFVDESNK